MKNEKYRNTSFTKLTSQNYLYGYRNKNKEMPFKVFFGSVKKKVVIVNDWSQTQVLCSRKITLKSQLGQTNK